MLTVLRGGNSWTAMWDFGRAREVGLRNFVHLPRGIHSAQTLAAVCVTWTRSVVDQIARAPTLDSKAIRESANSHAERSPACMFSAWSVDNTVVFGQHGDRPAAIATYRRALEFEQSELAAAVGLALLPAEGTQQEKPEAPNLIARVNADASRGAVLQLRQAEQLSRLKKPLPVR